MRGSVPNIITNSVEFLRQKGPEILDAVNKSGVKKEVAKTFKRAVEHGGRFSNEVGEILSNNIGSSRWGNTTYGSYSPGGNFSFRPDQAVKDLFTNPARFTADFLGSNVFSEKNRQKAWLYTNPFRLVSKAGVAASKYTGLENPAAAGAVAAGVPILFHTLTETSGPLHQGLRPKGYKAVAPVSKEEDPTGATPRSVTEEAALRFFAGQKSQPLAYKDFIKERPDVMPSTVADYRRYMNRKPEAGKRIDIDPEKQTFTAFGGLLRGTARGLNDPEIRIKGAPVSASALLGTAAGVATVTAGKRFLDPRGLGISKDEPIKASGIDSKVRTDLETGEISRGEYTVGTTPTVGTRTGKFYQSESPEGSKAGYAVPTEKLQDRLKQLRTERQSADIKIDRAEKKAANVDQAIGQFMQSGEYIDIPGVKRNPKINVDTAKEEKVSVQQDIDETVRATKDFAKKNLNIAGQKFQEVFAKNPGLKEPALVVGGLAAAVGTAAVAKKLFQKAEQERIKKEDPLQYKKYKRGDYTE